LGEAAAFCSFANDFRFRRLARKAASSRLVSASERFARGLFAIPGLLETLPQQVKPKRVAHPHGLWHVTPEGQAAVAQW
jgi:hypothetical protein